MNNSSSQMEQDLLSPQSGASKAAKNSSYFSYDNQNQEWLKILSDPERKRFGDTWFRDDTVDAWRHKRMREPLKVFIEKDADCSWLTVGDGRYGTDAN